MSVNDKRWKIRNEIRMRGTHHHIIHYTHYSSSFKFYCNTHGEAASLSSSSRSRWWLLFFCNPIRTGIYLEAKLLCDYKFSFRQLSDEKHKQKLWHENNKNNFHHRAYANSGWMDGICRVVRTAPLIPYSYHHRLLVRLWLVGSSYHITSHILHTISAIIIISINGFINARSEIFEYDACIHQHRANYTMQIAYVVSGMHVCNCVIHISTIWQWKMVVRLHGKRWWRGSRWWCSTHIASAQHLISWDGAYNEHRKLDWQENRFQKLIQCACCPVPIDGFECD